MWKQPISKIGVSCYNDACLWKGMRTMLYTTEEAAVICGFLNAHLAQAGVEVSVRKRNAAFQRGVIMGTLQPDDYRWAENVLCFLKPCWWQLHEDHRALCCVKVIRINMDGRIRITKIISTDHAKIVQTNG